MTTTVFPVRSTLSTGSTLQYWSLKNPKMVARPMTQYEGNVHEGSLVAEGRHWVARANITITYKSATRPFGSGWSVTVTGPCTPRVPHVRVPLPWVVTSNIIPRSPRSSLRSHTSIFVVTLLRDFACHT